MGLPKHQEVFDQIREHIHHPERWDSIVVNRRKPYTYRAFIFHGVYRICLHRFDPCEEHEAFFHRHPWDSRIWLLDGFYEMVVGHCPMGEENPVPLLKTEFYGEGSGYESFNPEFWHKVIPHTTCYSVMVNGPRINAGAPTTDGKDLDKMSDLDLLAHLDRFKKLLLLD